MISQGNPGSQQLVVPFFRATRWQLAVQKRADVGLTNVQQRGESFGLVALARSRWLQFVPLRRQRGVHERGRHGFFPAPMSLCKNARQGRLHVERRHQPRSQQLERIGRQDVRGSDVRRAWFQKPGDRAALLTLDACKLHHGGPGAGFLLSRAVQSSFEPGMAGEHARETRAASTRFFDHLCETPERLALPIMAIIKQEAKGLGAAAHHLHAGPLALVRFARQVTVFVRGQIVIPRQLERIEIDAWHVKGQRFGHLALAFLPARIVPRPQAHGCPTAPTPRYRHPPALVDGDLEILEPLAGMRGCKVVHLAQTPAETQVFHDVAAHEPLR
jgi:hypothetical protein